MKFQPTCHLQAWRNNWVFVIQYLIIYPFIGWITLEMSLRNPILAFVALSSMFVGACTKGSFKGFKIKLVI